MGRQFANDSATPEPISVSRDSYKNEIPKDRDEHNDSTPGMGAFNWDAMHYSDDWEGGNKAYGVDVKAPTATTVDVRGDAANRGKES